MRRSRWTAVLLASLIGGAATAAADEAHERAEALARAIGVLATLDHAASHCAELVPDEALAAEVFAAAASDRESLRETEAYMQAILMLNRSQESYDYQTHCQTLLDRHGAELAGLLSRPPAEHSRK